jgi:hypothetical protein
MAQLNFAKNLQYPPNDNMAIAAATMSFVPINLVGSISFLTMNLLMNYGATASQTMSIGLYSLNGVSLSLVNSISGSDTCPAAIHYMSLTATSATSNIIPGTWWLGLLISNTCSLYGAFTLNPTNAFPGGFIQGRMKASTSALPANIEISNLNVTGSGTMFSPYILLSG